MSDQPESKPSDPVVKEISGRIGKYQVVKPIGKGAMGMVYEAYDTVLERKVALKVMVAGIVDDPELKERFTREARAVAKMTHPNVVMVFDLGDHTDGSPYIVMELLQGMDLQKAMRQQQMTLERKVAVMVQVLSGLNHAHQAKIIHRDIKPANIWIKSDGGVKIMDFGVARLTTASMTGTGSIVGTADYMSPEQVKGAKVDGRSDVFSVGCMLFELLAGRRPFRAENLMAIFYRITHEDPDWASIPQNSQTDALLPILRKALAKELDERYQSAYEFAVDLREYLKLHATSASGEHEIENLAELEPLPEGGPPPITDSFAGATVVEGTVDLGTGPGSRPGSQAPTVVTGGAATAAGARPGTAATVVNRPGMRPRVAQRPMRPTPVQSAGVSFIQIGFGALLIAVLGLGGFIYWSQRQPVDDATTTPTTLASVSTTVATPPPTPEPTATPAPTPTVAPTPTPLSPSGKAARNLRNAQVAFDRGDYDTAADEAQAAMRIDPGNADARGFLARAMKGQEAAGHFRTASAALGSKDFAGARRAAQAGSALAPWDRRGPQLIGEIQTAETAAQQRARATQLQALLNDAQSKLAAQDYAATIALADQVLATDPANPTANQLKTAAVSAKAIADAAAAAGSGAGRPAGGGKSFVSGKTDAQTKQASDVPPGFRDDSGIQATAATSAAATPGKLEIEVSPKQVKPGDQFTIRVRMHNQGTAPIQIGNVFTQLITNVGRGGGPVPSLVAEVAPRQDAVILEAPGGIWREDYTEFKWVVRVSTRDGATYRNEVEWK